MIKKMVFILIFLLLMVAGYFFINPLKSVIFSGAPKTEKEAVELAKKYAKDQIDLNEAKISTKADENFFRVSFSIPKGKGKNPAPFPQIVVITIDKKTGKIDQAIAD